MLYTFQNASWWMNTCLLNSHFMKEMLKKETRCANLPLVWNLKFCECILPSMSWITLPWRTDSRRTICCCDGLRCVRHCFVDEIVLLFKRAWRCGFLSLLYFAFMQYIHSDSWQAFPLQDLMYYKRSLQLSCPTNIGHPNIIMYSYVRLQRLFRQL